MRTATMAVLTGLTVLGLAGMAHAGPPPPSNKPSVQWASSWEAAVEEAKARNVPIFVSFHMDN